MGVMGVTDLGQKRTKKKDKKGEEVRSLKPAENHLLQGWAQEDGAKGRRGEVLGTMRGAGWTLEPPAAYQWCQCDGEALTDEVMLTSR